MRKLGLDSQYDNDRQKFQRRIKALLNKNDGAFYVCVGSRRENGKCHYHLSRDYFDSVNSRIVANARNTITTKPRERVVEQQERIQELERENSELQDYVQRMEDESQHDREKREAVAQSLLRHMVYEEGMPDNWSEYHEKIRDRLLKQAMVSEDTGIRTIEDYTKEVREEFERKYIG